jgi:hypothetical protein
MEEDCAEFMETNPDNSKVQEFETKHILLWKYQSGFNMENMERNQKKS